MTGSLSTSLPPVTEAPPGYWLPTVGDFRKRFPEFSQVPDATVDMLISEASMWVDYDWMLPDYQLAILYYAAHIASRSLRAILLGNAAALGQTIASMSFRDRSVTYNSPTQAALQAAESWEGQFDTTPYGMMYRMYLYRNAPPVLIV